MNDTTYKYDTFLCIGPHVWGRGKSAKEAKKNAQREYSAHKRLPAYVILNAHPESYVNCFGQVCYPTENDAPLVVERKECAK